MPQPAISPLLLAGLLSLASLAHAGPVPAKLNYQATLTASDGTPITGSRDIDFSLYNSPTATTPFWTHTKTVPLTAGRLSVTLGGTEKPIDPAAFTGTTYIGIKVGTDQEMPRQELTSVAYALHAGDAVDPTPPGTVSMYAGATAPAGWLLCKGQAVSRTQYAALFAVIGTTYGAGDGSTTFNLPNLQGRFPVGKSDIDTDFATLNAAGGEKTHTLTIAELPSHGHGVSDPGHMHWLDSRNNDGTSNYARESSGTGGGVMTKPATTGIWIQETGGNQPHHNLPPYITMQFIVKH